ncbi:MAG: N-acetylneuraminate synthase family protein [Thermodesulfobacteriota bacterium]
MREKIKIGSHLVGGSERTYIIAEAGSNHNGSLDAARELIEAASLAGASAVKFQSFTAEGLLNPLRPDGKGGWESEPAFSMLAGLAMPWPWHLELKNHAESLGMDFLSTPFSNQAAELLYLAGMKAFKIASGDINNEPLLRVVGSYARPVILSTGASYMNEVEEAVAVLKEAGASEIALLHCSSLYPPDFRNVNLRAMATLSERFNCPVGISDHTPGLAVALGAVAMGGTIVEKHLTLDRKMSGPDHASSMEPGEFELMVREIRRLEVALGSPVKKPSEEELSERTGARRGIYVNVDIKKDTPITGEMVKLVRHAYGLQPKALKDVLGRRAARDLTKDMPLGWEDLCG